MQMTDAQVMTLAFSIVAPLCALIYSNSRITDTRNALTKSIEETKETLRAEMNTMKSELGAKLDALGVKMDALSAKVDTSMKQHVLELHK